jgi:hypothetical protein
MLWAKLRLDEFPRKKERDSAAIGSITGGPTLPIYVVFNQDSTEAFRAPMSGTFRGTLLD